MGGAPIAAPPGRGLRRAGVILAVVGAVLLVGAIAGGALLASAGIGGEIDKVRDAVPVSGRAELDLEDGLDLRLYREVGTATPDCLVSDEAGTDVSTAFFGSSTISTGGRSWTAFQAFRTVGAGTYSIECGSAEVLVAQPLSPGGIVAGVGGILTAIFGGFAGGIVLVGGIVLYVVGRVKAKRIAPPPAWGTPPF
ncbi:hypothetical protein GCG21_06585 [Pseudactinotalea sp. HY160]|uniref:hypothetical protein n=1 Tax=Pseudactinotalea sp. HY160 TaxID=2654490 RepID=UPI00128C4D25|nr:hypothetical protein [Pseudactinotalea sp. HY160]MPV49679.1 hypothetical protein [Pseudactinotalea sp. HY160]